MHEWLKACYGVPHFGTSRLNCSYRFRLAWWPCCRFSSPVPTNI